MVSDKTIIKVFFLLFPFGCYCNQSSTWIPNLWTTVSKYLPRIIPVKFDKNWPIGLQENVDCWQTTDGPGAPAYQ